MLEDETYNSQVTNVHKESQLFRSCLEILEKLKNLFFWFILYYVITQNDLSYLRSLYPKKLIAIWNYKFIRMQTKQ
jgi:hypothetical protein